MQDTKPEKPGLKVIAGRIADVSSGAAWVGRIVIMAMLIGMTYEVVARYVFTKPTGVMDQVTALLLVGLLAMGIGYTQKLGGHVRVDIVTRYLPKKVQRWLVLITYILSLIFCIILTYYLYKEVLNQRSLGIMAWGTLRVPVWVPEAVLFVGFVLLTWELIREVFRQVRKGGVVDKEEIEQI